MRQSIASSSLVVLFVLQCCSAFQAMRSSARGNHVVSSDGAPSESSIANGHIGPLHSSLLDEMEATSTDTDLGTSSTAGTTELPSVLQDIVDERREFEINLGRAMDTLRRDYPKLLHTMPEFSIYHDQIKVVDPSGVQLSGVKSYKQSFRFTQTIIGLFYDVDKSMINHRMVYDWARQSIRISWNAMIVPKVVGNRRNALYVDGASVYKLDAESGKIVEHKIENVVVNGTPLSPPYPVQEMLTSALLGDRRVPVGVGVGAGAWGITVEQ